MECVFQHVQYRTISWLVWAQLRPLWNPLLFTYRPADAIIYLPTLTWTKLAALWGSCSLFSQVPLTCSSLTCRDGNSKKNTGRHLQTSWIITSLTETEHSLCDWGVQWLSRWLAAQEYRRGLSSHLSLSPCIHQTSNTTRSPIICRHF